MATMSREKIGQQDRKIRASIIEREMMDMFRKKGKVHDLGNEWCDFLFRGIPIEVKSSELVVYNGHSKGRQNHCQGSFVVEVENHRMLKEKEGWYCLVLLIDGREIHTRMLPANVVKRRHRKILLLSYYEVPKLSIKRFFQYVKNNIKDMKTLKPEINQILRLRWRVKGFQRYPPDDDVPTEKFQRIFRHYCAQLGLEQDVGFDVLFKAICLYHTPEEIMSIHADLDAYQLDKRKQKKKELNNE